MDVESLNRGARHGRWLDHCLVLSVVFLFAAVVTLAAAGVLVARDLHSELLQPQAHLEFDMSKITGDAPNKTSKMQNFVYLATTSSKLMNQTMLWTEKSVSSNCEFNSQRHSLHVKQAGWYFMFVNLNISCTNYQKSHFRVQVSDKLTCDVLLPPPSSSEFVTKRCWTVSFLSNDTHLLSQMTVPSGPLQSCKLEHQDSGFGMFLVG